MTSRSRPRVCIVTCDIVGPIRNGGIGTAYYSLAVALARAGHDVTVLYALGRHCEQETIPHWVRVYRRLGITFVPLPAVPGPEVRGNYAVRTSLGVYHWLRSRDFDVVHVHEWRGLGFYTLLARGQGLCLPHATVCVGVHSPTLWHKEGMHEPAASAEDVEIDYMERESAARADVLWAPSAHMLRWMEEHHWRMPRARFVRQYVMVDPVPTGKAEPAPRPVEELCFFGRLETRKGLDIFCDALDELVASGQVPGRVTLLGKIATVGGVDSAEYLKRRAQQWPMPYQVISTMDRDTALAYLKGPGRLAVLPSRIDNLPYTVLECLWAGIPFVACETGGIPEMVHEADRPRTLCALNGTALAACLREALTVGATPARFAVDPARTTREWVAWHEELAARPRRRRATASVSRPPLVSVCVTHRNRPALLRQALASLMAQDYGRFEVIVVDDGSDLDVMESQFEKIESFCRTRKWRFVKQARGGPSAARNTAARLARGKYLLFMDDDNVAKPHEISTFVQAIETSGADIVTCFLDVFAGATPPRRGKDVAYTWSFLGGAVAAGAFKNCFGDTNSIVRRRVYRALDGMTEDTGVGGEDWEFLAKAALAGYRVEVVPEALVFYRQSHTGVNNSTPPRANHLRALRPYRGIAPAGLANVLQVCAAAGPTSAAPASVWRTDDVRRVVVFGCGQGGRRALDLAARCGWRVAYMVDNNQAAWNTAPHGVPVRPPADLARRDFDMVLIASMAGRQQLAAQLEGLGLSYGSSYAFFLDRFSIDNVQVQLTL
jgi:glycosyltransferase involved in cell wall biosynthesis/GT2 family glycosyltransferase